ncbi:MAG: mechanosensitive ion channel, partial [Bacteroidales bacterium]|nr:mechanosensitive ion channel [Bacteroidales bacterium]
RLFRALIGVFILLLFISIIANMLGAFSLAEFFTLLPIQIAVLAIGIQVSTKVADAIVFLFLASNYMQKVNVIREEFRVIFRKTVWLIDLFLWIFFFSTALQIFRIKDAVFDWGRRVLTDGMKIGAVDITLLNILIFVFVIWLSIVVTRIVRHILEKDVFTRVHTAKGIPSTVILLVRIAMISGGFFLAAAAAGMKLTNLSIVLGAFSVGIGFGLQNIFNNMVSGLILAFERPIKVGDVVQVGELIGIVRTIGLRSSTVKSFDGAEVIVPNGNLISNEMINWTLSDSNRRMDIRVGVAYGTDPEIVIGIIQEIAAENSKVRKQPAPTGYFLGFGDSSLDFRLLAWTDIDHRLTVESELNVAVNTKLKEAGIEIPFPQRDLHIRSDATKPKPAGGKK